MGAAGGGGPPDPTIAFRSLTSTTYASRTDTTLAAPAGLADNDILVAVILVGRGSSPFAPTPPAGFVAFGTATSVTDGVFVVDLYVFWKRAASESGSYTFTHAAQSSQGLLKAYSGCLTSGTPLNATANNTGTGTTSIGSSITTTDFNSFLLFESHEWDGTGGRTPPTGMSERFDSLQYSADELITAIGATGARSYTNANSNPSFPWAVRMIELLAV